MYDESDERAKRVAVEFLLSLGGRYVLEVGLDKQPEYLAKYDFEIRDTKRGIIGVEAERKLGWKCSGEFPKQWDTMQVSCRKSTSQARLFIMVNEVGDTIAVCKMSLVTRSQRVTLDTRLTKKEEFFTVPITLIVFFYHPTVGSYWEEFREYNRRGRSK